MACAGSACFGLSKFLINSEQAQANGKVQIVSRPPHDLGGLHPIAQIWANL